MHVVAAGSRGTRRVRRVDVIQTMSQSTKLSLAHFWKSGASELQESPIRKSYASFISGIVPASHNRIFGICFFRAYQRSVTREGEDDK
jgi:hypothetical protein